MSSGVPPQVVDVVGLGIFVAGSVYQPEVAAVVGPYVVILLGSVIGASFAVARRDRTTRTGAILYFSRVVGLAVLLAVGAATAANRYFPMVPVHIFVPWVSLLIGFFGDDFPDFARRFMRVVGAGVDLLRGSRGGEP